MIFYKEPNHSILYSRLLDNQESSQYFVGMKSTSIVCRLVCKAHIKTEQDCIFSAKLHILICYNMKECTKCNPLSHNAPQDMRYLLDKIQNSKFPEKSIYSSHIQAQNWIQIFHKTDLLKYICAKRNNNFLASQPNIPLLYPTALTYQWQA